MALNKNFINLLSIFIHQKNDHGIEFQIDNNLCVTKNKDLYKIVFILLRNGNTLHLQHNSSSYDSERTDKCMDFTMIPVFHRKVNLIGTLGVKSKNSNFYEIYQNRENLQVILEMKNHKIFCIYIFPSSSYKENSKHHYRKNFNISHRYLKILPTTEIFNFSEKNFRLTFEVQILTKIRQNHEYLSLKHKPPFSPISGNYILG
ncbi:hypothetical protein AGLY_008824 [Aphis glycines]|uniref:Uncharacterized protein n=1 Tax=Aphis glycines TaxID=307491 RepID=A0A6G0TK96_APHGL|nr:hypothetical protein AGLY_008824 [Aphis glycines]